MLENVNINLDANALVDSLKSIGEPAMKIIMEAGADSINAGVMRGSILMWIFGILSALLLGLFIFLIFIKEEDVSFGVFFTMIFSIAIFFFGLYNYTQYKYSPKYMATQNTIYLIKSIK